MSGNFILVEHPLIKRDVTIIRDIKTNTEGFRGAVQRISTIIAVNVLNDLKLAEISVDTPLETTIGHKLLDEVVLVPVLRAGLGMVAGFIQVVPDAKVGHIGLQRDEITLQPVEYYYKTPKNIEDSTIIMLDPMLATGGSATEAINFLKQRGASKIIFACLVAAPEGIKKVSDNHKDVKIFGAALDRELNNKGYILPGLGDAGDRTFGTL